MKKSLPLVAFILLSGIAGASAQMLLAGYDFQTSGNAVAASPNTPTSYISPFGVDAGTAGLYLDGTNGSSSFSQATELAAFTGTAVNAGPNFATSTTSPACLAPEGGTGESADGKTAVFTLSMVGYSNLVLTFASQKTGTGFAGNIFSYSTDGVNFTPMAGTVTPAAAFATITEDFSGITALNNAPTVYIGYTFEGATSTAGNNRLDNIQFNATALAVTPEPSSYAIVALGGFGTLAMLRYRRRSS